MATRIRPSIAVLGALALLVGCQGGGAGGDGDGDGDSTGTTGAGSESGDDTAPSACTQSPGRVGLQRLTRAEYNRTVRDLFGITNDPADAFPPDSATNGFDNNAASLTVSPQLASLLLDAAEQVAADALANPSNTILSCDGAEAGCAADTLAALALRVYRRPATTSELDALLGLFAQSQAEGDPFSASIEHALVGMLMAPQFLYRSVPPTDLDAAPGTIVALDDYALATRLSYFVWGSTPDDALLAAAAGGALTDDAMLRSELDRMLADPKASALFDGFVQQWLQLGKLAAATPDLATFPAFDEALRTAMHEEMRRFFDGVRTRDGSALELIMGTQTFANAALAEIYGVDGPVGDELVAIETDPTQRAGVLTMPAVLTMTAGPIEPNIVKRGVWLAETILCAAPPPPPEGVPPPPDPQPDESERERLARHREDPSCASCHNLIDPLGFGFEHYDALGSWRDDVDGVPVDDLGTLPDGRTYNGMVELAGLLANSDDYPRCVTGKLMTYSLGRVMGDDDACRVDEIGTTHVTLDGTFSDLLWAVVTSEAFRSEEVAP